MNTEYIHFIKSFLASQCWKEYLEIIKNQPEKYPMNKWIADKIFQNKSSLIDYYIKITNTPDSIPPNYENRTFTIYEYDTFHQYINSFFHFNNLTNWNTEKEYKKYVSSITKNRDEYYKIVEKYKQDAKRRILKNHILYIIRLMTWKDTNPEYILSDEEKQNINLQYDLNNEYFIEYFISKGFSFRDYFMENGNIIDQIEDPDDYLEYSVFQEIKLAYQDYINNDLFYN